MIWHTIVQVILVYTAIYVPIKVTYFDESIKTPFMDSTDRIVDILFVIDVVVNFITAFERSDGVPVTKLNEIAK